MLQDAKLALKNNDLDRATRTLQQLLAANAEHRDGLYYLGVCQRQSKDLAAAKQTLLTLTKTHSDYGRAYQELGHVFLGQRNVHAAYDAYRKAIALNPTLTASWKSLALIYQREGRQADAEDALDRARALSRLPSELLTVNSLIYEKKWFVAEQICRQFLQRKPHHVEAMRLLARIATELNILDDAEFLLESCAEFEPNFLHARLDYIKVLHRRQRFKKALQQADEVCAEHPDNIATQIARASALQAVGEFDRALEAYDVLVAQAPQLHTTHMARGHSLKTVGHTEQAVESYRRAYQCKPDFGEAFWSLANLKTYRFTEDEMAQMRDRLDQADTSDEDRIHFNFALGKALEDSRQYDESFAFYERGNHLKQLNSGYRAERIEVEFEAQKTQFTAEFIADKAGSGCSDAAPIFILGLPRAGSTLLEQILASHSQVDGTMELANIIGLAHRLSGRHISAKAQRYPAILGDLDADTLRQFGEEFIKETAYHRQGGAFFIDKMPNNFRHIGLIHLILPEAKIIDARRHPMACCFSGFKQLFAEGQEFTYGLESIGRYYRAYVDLMRHWDEVLPGKILRVQHEDLIDDLESQVRRMLDFCDLPFEQQCIDFHTTERAVRTPSSEQVRQPIYRSGTELWQHYSEFLAPLERALGPALSDYR